MQQTISACPPPDTRVYGCYEITAQVTLDGSYTINTMTASGGTRIPELCFGTPDRDTYSLAYAVIREGGRNYVHPDGVREALNDALIRARGELENRRDLPSRNRVEHINTLLDRLRTPAERAELAELVEHVRRNLADTVPTGRQPEFPRSRSGVEYTPLSAAQRRLIARHPGGVIYAGNGVAWTVLRSLVRKGCTSEVHYTPGTQRIAYIVLNERGLAAGEVTR